jgi:hypothetical protein
MQAPLLAGNILGSLDNSFTVAEWSDPGTPYGATPGSPRYIAPWHVHHNAAEAWYGLQGGL